MSATLKDFCEALQDCAEKLEENLKTNINDSHNKVFSGSSTDVKLALDKAKDFHYKEIMVFMREIVVNVKKIIYHEEQIRNLAKKEQLTDEELRTYSYVQRQVNIFDNGVVTRRDKRRVASNLSICSLDTWEKYMEDKQLLNDMILTTSLPSLCEPKTRQKETRKLGKIISSTFNDFLDDGTTYNNHNLEFISEEDNNKETNECIDRKDFDDERDGNVEGCENENEDNIENTEDITENKSDESNELNKNGIDKEDDKFPLYDLVKSLSEEYLLEPVDTKPKIVHVVYKNKPL